MRGEGRIFKVKGSRFWQIAFSYDGKEFRESSKTDNEQAARKALRKAIGQIENGKYVGPAETRLSFEDMAAALAIYYKLKGRASLKSLPYFLKPLREAFGADRARKITTGRVEAYADDRLAARRLPN